VREPWLCCLAGILRGGAAMASMGPRSENRGYAATRLMTWAFPLMLQWVHGPRTVVMEGAFEEAGGVGRSFNGSTVREPWLCLHACNAGLTGKASMGPRSENRGYERIARPLSPYIPHNEFAIIPAFRDLAYREKA